MFVGYGEDRYGKEKQSEAESEGGEDRYVWQNRDAEEAQRTRILVTCRWSSLNRRKPLCHLRQEENK